MVDVLGFISSIIHALAWPAAVIVLALTFRNPLTALIPRLSKAGWDKGSFQFLFRDEIELIAKEAADLTPAVQTGSTLLALPPPKEGDKTTTLLDEAADLAPLYPEPAVLVAWTAVESKLFDAAERSGLPQGNPRSASTTIRTLSAASLITTEVTDLLARLRNLRNIAAHPSGFVITPDDAREFTAIARSVTAVLRQIPPASG